MPATTFSACSAATNPGASPMTTNSWDASSQWAGDIGACDNARTSPGGANFGIRRGSLNHLGCGCEGAATSRINTGQQFPQCPSPQCPMCWCPSPKCLPPWGVPGWLPREGVDQFLHWTWGDGHCVRVRVGFLSCSFLLFQLIRLRHCILHTSQGFWVTQGWFYSWVWHWFYVIHSVMGHCTRNVFATPGV